ncbi:MAG TPA: hypothetical protein VFW45_02010 [Candidatus Polarisedimenticolia bacterium]|nr:hypothetical protein [Candidatus Polarisedimenticolia bacterium]
MPDLKSPALIWTKGILFLILAMAASVLLLLEAPSLKTAALLALALWAACRFYYFAFYVIEKYVDPGYRFAGLGSFLVYALKGRRRGAGSS